MSDKIEYSRLLLKRSSETGVIPTIPTGTTLSEFTTTDLFVGELFLNTADDNLWVLTDNGLLQILNSGYTSSIYATGFTYNNNTLTISNNNGSTLDATINDFTGLTINGIISASTISGGTFYGDGSGLTGINTGDIYVTGFTYNPATNTFQIIPNSGGTLNATINEVSGLTVNGTISASTISGGTLYGDGSNLTGLPVFSGGSGNCITDLYVTNIHGCSPITFYDSLKTTGSTASGISSVAFGSNTVASGDYSTTYGADTVASGSSAYAEGKYTIAGGNFSHAQGESTTATGRASHSEGTSTTALGRASHAEGSGTTATSIAAHAEGVLTWAYDNGTHAEGIRTSAITQSDHSEGYETQASGGYSHAEGYQTQALNAGTHAEGYITTAIGDFGSHAEGRETTASGTSSHAEGYLTQATGDYSHSEGAATIASGLSSHAEGDTTQAIGVNSHAEGYLTQATGNYSHSEGASTQAIGQNSHAEGDGSIASGMTSHAEGSQTQANGTASHSEGSETTANGDYSHAQGEQTTASGLHSHSQGYLTVASGDESFAGGYNSTASGVNSFIYSVSSIVTADRAVVLGGQNITGTTNDTVYVPYLNIDSLATGTSVNNLGIDVDGNVVIGSSGITTPDLSQVLTVGNTTSGNNIVFSSGGDRIESWGAEAVIEFEIEGAELIHMNVTDGVTQARETITNNYIVHEVDRISIDDKLINQTMGGSNGYSIQVEYDSVTQYSRMEVEPEYVKIVTDDVPANLTSNINLDVYGIKRTTHTDTLEFNANGLISVIKGTGTNTTTTATPLSITEVDGSGYSNQIIFVKCKIFGIKDDVTLAYSAEHTATFFNQGGTVGQIGTTESLIRTTFTTASSNLTTNGTDIRFRATGEASTTINWNVIYEITVG